MEDKDYDRDNQPGYENEDANDEINEAPQQSQDVSDYEYAIPEPQAARKRPRGQQQYYYGTPPKQTSKLADGIGSFFKSIGQIIKYIFFGFSVIGNLVLLMLIIIAIVIGYAGYKGRTQSFGGFGGDGTSKYSEYTIIDGRSDERIVVVEVMDVITAQTAEEIRQQFAAIANDGTIRGVILRIQSPGGSVSASDQLHHMIGNLSEDYKLPVMAFMSGIAASGGYYAAVACDRIIAEPTTITGSIGVLVQTFTMQELFESKLGINAVTIKSGEKKDWPNSFKDVTPEQIEYLDTKLIRPAYDRFVDLVDKGRPLLNREQILPLADGSIYFAQEAMDKGLIDQIGYLEDAVEAICKRADLVNPKVIGYQEIFGFRDLLQMKSGQTSSLVSTGKDLISEIQSPKLMYLWQID